METAVRHSGGVRLAAGGLLIAGISLVVAEQLGEVSQRGVIDELQRDLRERCGIQAAEPGRTIRRMATVKRRLTFVACADASKKAPFDPVAAATALAGVDDDELVLEHGDALTAVHLVDKLT